MDGRMEEGMKRWSEWAIVLLLQTGHSGKYPREQSFFKVASYSASYLCMCVCLTACSPLGLNNVQSGWYLSPHRKKKSVTHGSVHVCMSVRWLGQVPEVPTSLPGQIEGQQLLAKNVLCSFFPWHASKVQIWRMKCMTVPLSLAKWMTPRREIPLCRIMPCLGILQNTNTLQELRLYNDFCDKTIFACIIHQTSATLNKIHFHFLIQF